MKTAETTEKFRAALEKMFHNYEKLIANPEKYKAKWKDYGKSTSCLICKVQDESPGIYYCCNSCPLECPNGRCGDLNYPKPSTGWELDFALKTGENARIKAAAKARYKSLIECINSKGWKYE